MIPQRRPTRLPPPLARALSALYAREIARRNRNFDKARGVERVGDPVISVGNLSAGGTGKTPLVQHIARTLAGAAHTPAIAMRGYRAAKGQRSDEELEHTSALPETPIVASPDRVAGIRVLLASREGARVDRVVLDDGFQHRRLARDLDIVVIYATRPPTRDALLPLGYLREPMASLARADHIVLTHAERADDDEIDRLERAVREHAHAGVGVSVCAHAWDTLEIHYEDGVRDEPASWLADRRVGIVCGIGNPDAFVGMVKDAGATVAQREILGDHGVITPSTIAQIARSIGASGDAAVVMTPKDMARIRAMGGRPGAEVPVAVPRLVLRFVRGGEDLDRRCLEVAL